MHTTAVPMHFIYFPLVPLQLSAESTLDLHLFTFENMALVQVLEHVHGTRAYSYIFQYT